MAYTRKTKDVFVLQGHYGGISGWEDLTEEETLLEIKERKRDYAEHSRSGIFRIVVRREKITA